MSATNPNSSDFDEWDRVAFVDDGTLESLVPMKKQLEIAQREALDYDLEFAMMRARHLGMLSARQYHSVPLEAGWLEVMGGPLGTKYGTSDEYDLLRVTVNIKPSKMTFPCTVTIEDYLLDQRGQSLAVHKGEVVLSNEDDITEAAAPLLWRAEGEDMKIYNRAGYQLPALRYGAEVDEQTIVQTQRQDAAALEKLLHKLSREVSLEEEEKFS